MEYFIPDFNAIKQIDGGPENANAAVLALCEYLVAQGMTKELRLTRLPVGHTHEDIDGKFGTLWRGARKRHLITPQVLVSTISLSRNANVILYFFCRRMSALWWKN